MALTDEQRAELEALGPETVRIKLSLGGADRGASIPGFKTGPYRALTRSDIEDWLAEQHIAEARVQSSTLRWAKIAGWAGIGSVVIGIVAIAVAIRLAN